MTFESFIAKFEQRSKTARGVMVRCPSHQDGTSSLSIGKSKDGGVLLKCFAGCQVTDIVHALGLELKDLFAQELERHFTPVYTPSPSGNGEKHVIEKIYSYADALGQEVYQVVRLKPKTFRQRHKVDDKWVWNMDGVERVLYRLPEVMKAKTVWNCEGEKDCDSLAALGFCATCNVGGAGKWLDAYSLFLAEKEVVICGDNDDPGQKHVLQVFDSVSTKATMVKVLKLPPTVKDVTDYIATFPDPAKAAEMLTDLATSSTPHYGGIRMPVYSMADIEPFYQKQVSQSQLTCLDLGQWLPTLRGKVRPLVPGELCLIIGDTGIGKTLLLQAIAVNSTSLKTLMFELELPMELLFERFWANKLKIECVEVENEYRRNGCRGPDELRQQFPNLFICPEPALNLEQLETIITRSELKIGQKPVLVLLDYVQLMAGVGNSRYEKTSNIAEGLKTVAKRTGTIIVVASQVTRDKDSREPGLHSGKDSGSLENSAGLVLGVWRDEKDATLMHLRVLKSTKGGAGTLVKCNIDGARSTITERAEEPKVMP